MFEGKQFSSDEHDNRVFYLELYSLRWVIPSITGTIPIGRRNHSVFVNNKMIIFEGYDKELDKHFNDFHSFDPDTGKWSKIEVKELPIDSHRKRSFCCVIKNRTFIFGG